jgi:hypothetical protein
MNYSDMTVARDRPGGTLSALLSELETQARAVARISDYIGDDDHSAIARLEEAIEALDAYDLSVARGTLRNKLYGDLRRALTKRYRDSLHESDEIGSCKAFCSRRGRWASDAFEGTRCKQHADIATANRVDRDLRDARRAYDHYQWGGAPDEIAGMLAMYRSLGVEAPELPDWAS